MKKHILMLSAAATALIIGQAWAADPDYTDITTKVTEPVDTATAAAGLPGDIKLDTGGSIVVTTAGAAVTINSNNSFDQISGTTISNKDTADASGILVDLTAKSLDATNDGSNGTHTIEGIVTAGTIDLTGTGTTKRGLWLEGPTTGGPFSFTGNIDMTGSTMTITGDSSDGVLIDSLAELNGNLTLGTITMKPSSDTSTAGLLGVDLEGVVNGDITQVGTMTLTGNSTTSGSLIGMNLAGIVNGNVVIAEGAGIAAYGNLAKGILLTGSINACNVAVAPACTSLGSLINNGTISVAGKATANTSNTGNPVAGNALGIGGNIAGGIYNAGQLSASDTTATAVISSSSPGPAILISPTLQDVSVHTNVTIGVYNDASDPGFSFYNRGTVSAASPNYNQSSSTIQISGDGSAATTTLTGGLFNSGTISATSASLTGGTAVAATAISIGSYATVGGSDTYTYDSATDSFTYNGTKSVIGDQAAFVNSSESGIGQITATISGPMGGTATALVIGSNATVPSLINGGTISAIASTTDLTIGTLSATAIQDYSGTLTYIENNGTILAAATTLNSGGQVTNAIDLSHDTIGTPSGQGVLILNQATANSNALISGNILFGVGDHQVVDVEGATTSNLATISGNISFGGGTTDGFGSDELTIGNFATVTGTVTAANGVTVDIRNGGTFVVTNDSVALNAQDFTVESGGTLDLTVKQDFETGIITAKGDATLASGAKFGITYGSFIPTDSAFVLISAPTGNLHVADLAAYQTQLDAARPFLFQSAELQTVTTTDGLTQELVLDVVPKNAQQLGLIGYAAQMLPYANQALVFDDVLGAAMVAGITDQKTAQQVYGQFAPDVTGGTRQIAVTLTDQATGPVAQRQRMLRMYGKADGDLTLWGQEFAEFIKDPGDKDAGKTGFKDHGFGFVLGADTGSPKGGWYGGAFSFYSGDVVEALPRNSHSNSLWYMLSGYTDWRGRGLFLDTKFDVGYVDIKEKRYLNLTIPTSTGSTSFVDEADSKRPGLVGSAGFTTGVMLAYGSTTVAPQFSMDAMTMREEGYTESHVGTNNGNGQGFDLKVQSYQASSLRAFIGADVREDLNLGDFFLQPDIRLGYRYDFLADAVKLKAAFANIGNLSTPTVGPQFSVTGPDPSAGNFVAGASVSTTTDSWTLGANFDFVRGTNGATQQVGVIHLLGRI